MQIPPKNLQEVCTLKEFYKKYNNIYVDYGKIFARSTIYIKRIYINGLQRKIFQKKFLTAVDDCVIIVVPLQEGSFFVPENKMLRRGRPGSVSGCLIDPIFRAKYSKNGGAAHGC